MNSDWLCLPCRIDGAKTECTLKLHPGQTHLSLQPKYNYRDYLDLVYRVPQSGFVGKELIGKTPMNREIWCLRFHKPGTKPRKKVMVVSRVHPYETGGSFCAQGLVELFEAKGMIEKQGNRLKYTTSTGEELLEYRKNWKGELLDKVMADYLEKERNVVNTGTTEEVDDHEELVENE